MSLAAAWLWFTLVAAVLVPLLGVYASADHGANGWFAAVGAVASCWAAGMAALAIVAQSRGTNAVAGLLLAMLIRLGGPMAVGIAVDARGGPLAEAGFFALVVVAYLATLVVETLLMVRMIAATSAAKPTSVASGQATGQAAGQSSPLVS